MPADAADVSIVLRPDGAQIACKALGRAEAPWVILSNSLATTHDMWAPQIAALADRFGIVCYDTRGHGSSTVGSAAPGLDVLAADVIAVLDHYGIARANVAGLSLGGMTALETALSSPERVQSVICADARADAPDAYRALWDGNLAIMEEHGMAALVAPTLERWLTPEFRSDPANEPALKQIAGMVGAMPEPGYRYAARCLQSLNLLPRLRDIAVPVLYLVGSEDPAAPPHVMAEMDERTPNSTCVTIPRAAHLSNIEQPDIFNAAMSVWLGMHG